MKNLLLVLFLLFPAQVHAASWSAQGYLEDDTILSTDKIFTENAAGTANNFITLDALGTFFDDTFEAELTNSSGLRNALSDETGTGLAVFNVSPNLQGQISFTGTAVDDDDCTGQQGSLWWDSVDARFEYCASNSGTPSNLVASFTSSSGLAALVSDETGSGLVVYNVSPNLQGQIDFTGTAVSDDDCTGQQGAMWWDSTDQAFEFCVENTGAPTEVGTGFTDSAGLASSLDDETGTGVTVFNVNPNLRGQINFTGTAVNDDDCTGQQGSMWWDSTDGRFEFCNDNSGTPAALTVQFTDSSGLAGILGDETGTGLVVYNIAPNLKGQINYTGTAVNDDDCTGQQGYAWWDSTDSRFEFCNANSGTPTVLGASFSDSSGLAGTLDDETGTGLSVFNISPNLQGQINFTGTAVNDDDCTGQQGYIWWDSTDTAFEFCEANSGVPVIIPDLTAHTVESDPHTGYMLESGIGVTEGKYIQIAAGPALPFGIGLDALSDVTGAGTSGNVLTDDGDGTYSFQIGSTGFVSTAPTYSDGTCTKGQYSVDASYIYICEATNTWDRVATAGWSNPTPTPPTLSSAVLGTNGTTLTLTFSEAITQGAGYNDNQLDIDATTAGDDVALTYSSGNTTNTHVYTAGTTILSTETVNFDFDGTANSLEDSTGDDLAAIVSTPVTNNSTQTGETSPTTLRPTSMGASTDAAATAGCTGPDLWACVDEASADDNASYITLNSGTFKYVTFASSTSVPAGSVIDSVRVYARIKTADVGDDVNLNLGSNYRASWTENTAWTSSDSYTLETKWTTNPVDSLAFEVADIDALEFGIGVRTPHAGAIDLTQIYVEVYWH